MNNREYFNSVAEKWDDMVYHDSKKINSILKMIGLKKGDKVLDVGTGTGVLIPFLHSFIGDTGLITAVDISENMIKIAKDKYSSYDNVDFIAGDALNAGLPAHYYDIIICYSMFPHFEDKQRAVKRLSGYLKEGGRLAICHSQSREAINNLHKKSSDAVKNDRLPNMDCIKGFFIEACLKTICEMDNSDMFVITGEKQYNK